MTWAYGLTAICKILRPSKFSQPLQATWIKKFWQEKNKFKDREVRFKMALQIWLFFSFGSLLENHQSDGVSIRLSINLWIFLIDFLLCKKSTSKKFTVQRDGEKLRLPLCGTTVSSSKSLRAQKKTRTEGIRPGDLRYLQTFQTFRSL